MRSCVPSRSPLAMCPRRSVSSLCYTIEPLEPRALLTALALVVDTTLDGFPAGHVSLRQALQTANANPGSTITFDPQVFATHQTITLNGNELEFAASAVTLLGPAAGVTIDANHASPALVVDRGATATLSGITVTHSAGSGISNAGTLALSHSTLTSNRADALFADDGGGLDNTGTATLTDVELSFNYADHAGGGIHNAGTLTLVDSTLSDNTARSGGGGGIANDAHATLYNVLVSWNSTSLNGGGILNSATLSFTGGTLYFNHASNDAGGLDNSGFASSTLTNVTVYGNWTSGYGGGVSSSGGGSVFLTNVTVCSNTAHSGGGIYTVAGVLPGAGPFSIANSVVSFNTADTSTGTDASGSFTSLGHNLVSETDGSSGWNRNGPDLTGTTSHWLNPELDSSADNGGRGKTMVPLPGSPLVDAGSNVLLPRGLSTDGRGLPRRRNGTVDIGAVEIQAGSLAPSPLTATALTITPAVVEHPRTLTFVARVTPLTPGAPVPTGTVTFLYANNMPIATVNLSPDGSATTSVPNIANGPVIASATYDGDADYDPSTSTPVTVRVIPAGSGMASITLALKGLKLPASASPGSTYPSHIPVTLTNGGLSTGGVFTIRLVLSTGTVPALTDPVLAKANRKLSLTYRQSADVGFDHVKLPKNLPAGTYRLIVQVTRNGDTRLLASAQRIKVSSPRRKLKLLFLSRSL